MKLPEFNTTKEAKAYLRANWVKGTNCPCCGQSVKLYKRKLNSGMAYALIQIYKFDKTITEGYHFFEVGKELAKTGKVAIALEYNKLAYWGLIETTINDNPDENSRSGFWRITDKGKLFVEGKITVPKQVYVYDAKARMVSKEQTAIHQALGDKFDYTELMNG
jgi:hypothetical protein